MLYSVVLCVLAAQFMLQMCLHHPEFFQIWKMQFPNYDI